eukprot:3101340-Amphidinium_carterae.1
MDALGTMTGEWQLSLVIAGLEVVQAGDRMRTLTVAAMHVRNTVAKAPDKVRSLLSAALQFMEMYQIEIYLTLLLVMGTACSMQCSRPLLVRANHAIPRRC